MVPVYKTDLWCDRGHFNEDQADKYAEICRALLPRYAVEVGFCTGRSAACVLHNTRGCLKRMISVDKNLDWKAPEGRRMAAWLASRFAEFKVVEASSRQVLTAEFIRSIFPSGIDLATVDGDHSYEECTLDMESIAPFLSRRGVMIVDDYRSGPPNGVRIDSVTSSVDDFIARHRRDLCSESWNSAGKGFCLIRRQTSGGISKGCDECLMPDG